MALKIAILGCGGVGRGYHAPAFAQVEGVEIVAACDIIEQRAKALADDHGVPWYRYAAEMLKKEEIDLVDVCTTERDRAKPLMQCLRAGKHVFCEKPLVGAEGQYNIGESDLIAAREIVDLWREGGKHFGINYNYRTAPHTRAMKQAIDSGQFGDPVMVTAFSHLASWSHTIDLVRWFVGDVTELTAYQSPGVSNRDRAAALKFRNGAIGTLAGSAKLSWRQPLLRIDVVGTDARGTIEDLTGEFRIRVGDEPEKTVWSPEGGDPLRLMEEAFTRSVTELAQAVRDGKAPPVTGTDAIRALEIDAAISMSAEKQAAVKIEHYG
jgi:predicted dehydrogenase